jgi:tRNA G18 (ribose-2'-O)-methylase SpoU
MSENRLDLDSNQMNTSSVIPDRNKPDTRNVLDVYKYWSVDAIRADLDTKRNDFSILITNEFHDFNIGSIIRNANAFLAKEVIIFGRRKFDKRGTVGTHIYENLKHVRFIDDLVLPENSVIVGVDNIPEAVALETFEWPSTHVVLAFGQEQVGLPEEVKAICDRFVYIKQYGSVRSLNVGCASAIAMYDYCSKIVK